MPKFEFRFDIAAILLASVLAALGVSAAQANANSRISGEELSGRGDGVADLVLAGGKGGASGGDVRSHGAARGARASLMLAGGKGGVSGGDVRSRGWFGGGQ